MNPIIVNRSIGRFMIRNSVIPPIVASGSAEMTSTLSTKERNSPLINKYRTTTASAKLRDMLPSAMFRSSALP